MNTSGDLDSKTEELSLDIHDTKRIAWFHCFAGIAGDMALGSLIDAGADVGEIHTILDRLDLPGWDLDVDQVLRCGLRATRVNFKVSGDPSERTYSDIVTLISRAQLPVRITDRVLKVFDALARTEAFLHNKSVDRIHFHEVGGHDAILDIVGTVSALELMKVEYLEASSVATGNGIVQTSHGLLPNPSPAAVHLLQNVPTYGRETSVELTTPTGAALLGGLARSFGPLPPMKICSSGFGAGSADLDGIPNCTQVVIGDLIPEGSSFGSVTREPGHPALLIESNLDDVTGEELSFAIEQLIQAGVYDAWITTALMKKGRPGHVLHALGDISHLRMIRDVICKTTGTTGVRVMPVDRWPLVREMGTISLEGQEVGIKISRNRAKPEFADVERVSKSSGLSPREVSSRAEEVWRNKR